VATTLDRLDSGRLDDAAVVFAVAFLVAAAIAYPIVSSQPALPVTVFAVPPLICATLSTSKRTAIVGIVSIIVATVLGVWDNITTTSLILRIGVVVLITALAVLSAALRGRSQRRLSAASEAAELHKAFQRGLAPRVAPPHEVLVSTRYIAGEERMHLGGDFFDAVALPDGDLAFVVGDVAGHGPREAAIGAAVRAGWKSAAYSAPEHPLGWIHLLARAFFEDRRFEEFVTVCTGRLEVSTGHAQLISAGHVWPVVIKERASVVPMSAGHPLGVDLPRDWKVTDLHLDRGDVLLVFTDGLTESRVTGRHGQRWGEEGLLRWLNSQLDRDPAWRPDLDEMLERFADGGTFADDVALMLIEIPATLEQAPVISEHAEQEAEPSTSAGA
jgi:serine phosphatase RsbU (regulator of sigma subunit)